MTGDLEYILAKMKNIIMHKKGTNIIVMAKLTMTAMMTKMIMINMCQGNSNIHIKFRDISSSFFFTNS